MKKIYIALAVLATALLSSCTQEKSFKDIVVGENEIAFVMESASTRSAESGVSPAVKGITIPMGTIENEALFLEETIQEMNPSPATRGVPVFNENLGILFNSLGVYADHDNFGDAIYEGMDEKIHNGGWRYHHNYNGIPWPDKTTVVDFYLRLPASPKGVTFTKRKNKITEFSLTSSLNGAEQEDVVFGQVSTNKKDHDLALPEGYPVQMKHALTGIKFANGHPNDNETKTIITKVEIIGLNGKGDCSIAADGTVTWSGWSSPSTEDAPFYLEFDNPDYVKADAENNPDGTVSTTGDKKWDSTFGSTWTSAAADRNLNEPDGSLTFWFIPQEITDALTLKVYFTVKTPDSVNGFTTDACHTIALGALLNGKYREAGNTGNLKWEAGQLRTYTLKPYDVDVEIEDSVTETVKSDLHVANTGNVDEYVRMLIMGNWYGWKPGTTPEQMNPTSKKYVEPSILVGYKYAGTEAGLTEAQKKEMILPWFREGYDLDNNPDTPNVDPYGHFDNDFLLAKLGSRDGKANDWADASGGFYYTMPIGPGEGIETAQAAATRALFESYTVTNVPTIYIATEGTHREEALGVHLVMEIVVQAIAVPTVKVGEATKNIWWLQAWYDATGIEKLDPDYVKDGKKPNEKYVTLWKAHTYGDSVYVEE